MGETLICLRTEFSPPLRSQRHRNRQTRGLPHIMRIAVSILLLNRTHDIMVLFIVIMTDLIISLIV